MTPSTNTNYRKKAFDIKSCNYELEIRSQVLSSKRILLRNFFSHYIKSTYEVNANLNASYLTKLRDEYSKLPNRDKISFYELQDSIEEMEVDETAKAQIFDMLTTHTNCSDLIKNSAE